MTIILLYPFGYKKVNLSRFHTLTGIKVLIPPKLHPKGYSHQIGSNFYTMEFLFNFIVILAEQAIPFFYHSCPQPVLS